jgi:hypothetical protein
MPPAPLVPAAFFYGRAARPEGLQNLKQNGLSMNLFALVGV